MGVMRNVDLAFVCFVIIAQAAIGGLGFIAGATFAQGQCLGLFGWLR